ncbi:hypothetical protein ACTXT7_002658 [Hymenolepis weldensis]
MAYQGRTISTKFTGLIYLPSRVRKRSVVRSTQLESKNQIEANINHIFHPHTLKIKLRTLSKPQGMIFKDKKALSSSNAVEYPRQELS